MINRPNGVVRIRGNESLSYDGVEFAFVQYESNVRITIRDPLDQSTLIPALKEPIHNPLP